MASQLDPIKPLLGIGTSVGVLAGVWTFASVELAWITWVAFVAWACFFAAGGGTTGLAKGLAANLAGVFWGWVISQGFENVSGSLVARRDLGRIRESERECDRRRMRVQLVTAAHDAVRPVPARA